MLYRATVLRILDAMSDESDPPRKHFQLKPREFESVNNPPRVPGETNASIDAEAAEGRIDVRDLFKQANISGPALANKPRATPKNDVHAVLSDNLARADAAGLNDLAPKPRQMSRRKRDYWLLFTVVNAFFVFVAIKGGNVMTLAYGGAGVILFTLGLTWVMWFVMDDY